MFCGSPWMELMDKYYYLAAELPFLSFGSAPVINREGFLSEVDKWLTDKEMNILLKADINDFSYDENSPEILRAYKKFEYNLRLELADLRKAKISGKDYNKPEDAYIEGKEDSPLDIEKKLLLLRWRKIEEEGTGHCFDLAFLISYFLKLQVLERLFTFDKQKGRGKFNSLCLSAVETAEGIDKELLEKTAF